MVAALKASGVTYAGSLNGVARTRGQRGIAHHSGMVPGEPDLRIYGHPARPETAVICRAAIELMCMVEAIGDMPSEVADVLAWLSCGAPSGTSLEMKLPSKSKRARVADPLAGADDDNLYIH